MRGKNFWRRLQPLLSFYLAQLRRRQRWVVPLGLLGLSMLIGQWSPSLGILAFLLLMGFFFRYYLTTLWRFGWWVRKFVPFSFPQLDLLVAPELTDATDWQMVAKQCEEALSELQRFFGFPLQRRLTLFVFPTMAEVNRLFQTVAGARALPHGDAILLAWDGWQAAKFPQEILRHELAHLFSCRLGVDAPAFKREGLATWLQGREEGKPIDFFALAEILSGNDRPLLWILRDAHFFTDSPASYFFAGSFTGFLMERFGWEAYRRFYAAADERNFEQTFERHFGMDLLAAERAWKQLLIARRSEFEPELSQAVRRKRVETTYNAWQFWLCIEEAEALLRDGEQDWRVIWYASAAHSAVGNYRRALELLQVLSERDEATLRPYRANLWLQIGHLYDLLGEREKAITAYQQALKEPDYWDEEDGSTHALARRFLQQPFTEQQVRERLRKRLRLR
jgi:tetratricopeptide (TPR) repeat protein